MSSDERYMQRAIDLARAGISGAAPNPMVGAVIVHNNLIIGEGYHEYCGQAHAEVNAVNSVKDPSLLSESTIYVTLEPCAHFGKTPPCADLLVKHHFKRVVVGSPDPFAQVNGKGIERLKNAGIETVTGVLKKKCLELNKRFFTFHQQKRPYIILKWAQTADGFIDSERTDSERGINWITAPETQVWVHQQRANESAILTGWKTILNDNPSLTVRAVSGKDPVRIVLDPDLKAPADSTVFTDGKRTVVLNKQKNEEKGETTFMQLKDFTMEEILKALHGLNLLSVIVEGGSATLSAFISAGNWDEATVITGKNTFGKGLAAPVINGSVNKRFSYGIDTITQYLPA